MFRIVGVAPTYNISQSAENFGDAMEMFENEAVNLKADCKKTQEGGNLHLMIEVTSVTY